MLSTFTLREVLRREKIARSDPGGYNLARNGGSSGECRLRPAQDDLGMGAYHG